MAIKLFRWHLWTLFEITRETFFLFDETYPGDAEYKKDMYLIIQTAIKIMGDHGFVVVNET